MNNNHRQAIVIGAGISGLTCAYRLKSLGVDVALVEKAYRVGGVIQSDVINGFMIERGPNSSQGTEELMALVEELGIMEEVAEGDPKAPAYVYYGGRLHAVPTGPGAFIKSNLLSARGKLRILAELFIPVRRSDEEESVASFVRRRIGSEAAERMIAPFVSGIYAGDSEQLSVQAAFPRLANLETSFGGLFRGTIAKALEARRAKKSASAVMDKAAPTRRRLVSFKQGMGFLTDTLGAHIGEDLMTGCEEIAITRGLFESCAQGSAQGMPNFTVDFRRAGNIERITCDQLIVAAPSRAAAALVSPISEELGRLLDEIEYPSLAIVYLAYDESAIKTPLNGFGFLVAPSERLKILGSVWNTSLFKGRAPEGKALLTVFIGGVLNPALARLADDELISLAHGELQKILGITGEPQPVAITRWERAIPQYKLGHAERVRRIEKIVSEFQGMRLIGNYLHGVSTGDCVKEADRVAREIATSLR